MNGADELQPLMAALRDLQGGQRRTALVTLTQTRGATFRGIGTRMLVHEDGSTVCELSGGCPQNDIMGHARQAIADGQARRVRYDEDSGLDVLMEMGCGGALEVLVEPLDGSSDLAWVAALATCLERRRPGRLATVFACDGQVLPARHAVWCEDHLLYENIDDPSLLDALGQRVHDIPALSCNEAVATARGRYEVLHEPIQPAHSLVVVGSSTTARALLPLAISLGWSATLVDFDDARLADVRVPGRVRKVYAPPSRFLGSVQIDAATSVVVMTHNLQQDADYLSALDGTPLAYLGLLGARGRVRRVLDLAGLADADIHGPVGLDLGSEGPVEIALSIVAEILAVLRGRQGGQLSKNVGAIH